MLWDDTYRTGIDELDESNKRLFLHIDALLDADSKRVCDEIDDFERRAIRHFEMEQELHDESLYPSAIYHKMHHESYIASLRRLKDRAKSEGVTLELFKVMQRNMVDFLRKHITQYDQDFADYYRSIN